MSDILIRGMELPKNEPLLVKINPDGMVSTTAKNAYKKYETSAVPPHGNLIDRNALYRNMFIGPDGKVFPDRDVDNFPHEARFEDIKRFVCEAPIIIPASVETEGSE